MFTMYTYTCVAKRFGFVIHCDNITEKAIRFAMNIILADIYK